MVKHFDKPAKETADPIPSQTVVNLAAFGSGDDQPCPLQDAQIGFDGRRAKSGQARQRFNCPFTARKQLKQIDAAWSC
jgi:hypothetical protein